jgi:hypothetical protein
MNGSLVQQHPSPLPKIGLSMSFFWVFGNCTSHGTCGVGMMQVGWVFVMLVLPTNWISIVLLLKANWVCIVFDVGWLGLGDIISAG